MQGLADAEIARLTRELEETRAECDTQARWLDAIAQIVGASPASSRPLSEAVREVVEQRDRAIELLTYCAPCVDPMGVEDESAPLRRDILAKINALLKEVGRE